jgi:tRNA1(Val) A37 N6-methylase TrmN6
MIRAEPPEPAMSLSQPSEIVKRSGVTSDAFLGGRLTLLQPERGFRAGLDSVLLGAAVNTTRGTLLDLGAGVGTAALCALTHQGALSAVLAEADPATAALARENIAANGFAAQAKVVELDVAAPGRTRTAAGLAPDHFESVIANPPFFEDGTVAAPQRAKARQMPAEALDRWVAAAASHAAPGGEIVFIHLAEKLPQLLAAFEARFGDITVLPLTPREGDPAHRVLIRGRKGSRAPFRLLASRALHGAEGRGFLQAFESIFRGTDRLHW